MVYENPFYSTYVTEQIMRNPKVFFEFFSPEILQEGVFRISQPMNHFILGAQGCGKTMFLRFFHYLNQAYIHNNNTLFEFYKKIYYKKLPRKFVGIYYTVSLGPYTQFQGRNIKEEKWANLYGNYLNLVLLEEIIRLLSFCATEPGKKWSSYIGINVDDTKITESINKICNSGFFPVELFSYQKYQSLLDFHEDLKKKISQYHDFLGKIRVRDIDLPNNQIDPGRLPIILIETLRDIEVLDQDTRLFILFDEYQELGLLSKNKLLPRIINSAIKLTARIPQTLIEYKIGTRRYGIKEFRIFGGDTKIEREREFDIIDLEEIFSGFHGIHAFRRFISDITHKRLEKHNYFRTKDFYKWFYNLPPRKNIKVFLRDDFELNKLKRKIEVTTFVDFDDYKKVYETYIDHLPKDKLDQLISILLIIRVLNEKMLLRKEDIIHYIDGKDSENREELIQYIESKKTEKGWKKQTREMLLFTLSHIYNKQVKYFGFDAILKASYPIVLHYLRLCKKIFETAIAEFEAGKSTISLQSQNRGFKIVSEDIFNEIAAEKIAVGTAVQNILIRLGYLFQELQKIVPAHLVTNFQISTNDYLNTKVKSFINEAVDFALLRRIDTKIDNQYISKFYLNKILCPYFSLSIYPEEKFIIFKREEFDGLILQEKIWLEIVDNIKGRITKQKDSRQLNLNFKE